MRSVSLHRPWFAVVAIATLSVSISAGALIAAPPAAPPHGDNPPGSLDDQLLDSLQNDLLDQVGGVTTDPPEPDGHGAADGEDIGQPGEEDPLARIGRKMRSAESLIPDAEAGDKTRRVQRQIVDDLARLIQQLEQQNRQSSSGGSPSKSEQKTSGRQSVKQPMNDSGQTSGQQSNQPARDSSTRLGRPDVKAAELDDVQDIARLPWGALRDRDREEMQQQLPERFLPKYESLIRDFYKRLSEKDRSEP